MPCNKFNTDIKVNFHDLDFKLDDEDVKKDLSSRCSNSRTRFNALNLNDTYTETFVDHRQKASPLLIDECLFCFQQGSHHSL
jgi:hypothetical protein